MPPPMTMTFGALVTCLLGQCLFLLAIGAIFDLLEAVLGKIEEVAVGIDTAVLGWLVERVTQGSVAAYTERCVWEPLGAEADGFYIMDGAPGIGREFSGAGFNATLRDFARFGQMVLDGGVADGRRIVSEDWIRASTQPTDGEDAGRGGYGLQWWTLGNTEAFAAIGLQGQYIYIDPATRTVVVKLSYFPPGDNRALEAETMAFMAAASAWRP